MKQYLLTHESFTGEVKIFYNDEKLLNGFDCSATNLSAKRRDVLKQIIPVQDIGFDAVKELIKGCQIIEEDVAITFEMFWLRYDKKINRKRCEALWKKLSKAKQVAAYYGIWKYERFLTVNPWRGKLDPENYLSNEMWENDWK